MQEKETVLGESGEHDLMPQVNANGSPIPSPEIQRNVTINKPAAITETIESDALEVGRLKKHIGDQKKRFPNPFAKFKKASSSVITEYNCDAKIAGNDVKKQPRSRADCKSNPEKPNYMKAYL